MFVLLVTEKIERQFATLGCAALTLIVVFSIGLRDFSALWSILNLESFGHIGMWYSVGAAEPVAGIN